jgi:hypothetical protein
MPLRLRLRVKGLTGRGQIILLRDIVRTSSRVQEDLASVDDLASTGGSYGLFSGDGGVLGCSIVGFSLAPCPWARTCVEEDGGRDESGLR